ncbi:hypothetical protein PICMEDRAFT_17197 [Pichia membranifaciens NRRL Y-2026]|uniref:Septin-type G domain-containing protein n=1 Tax=Pichia membranifaciens NRRL Y-2026 TaxID=763406 RepID=A0A1E3NIK1_9ASCO|nr:hypothetical protein PICMEDRAFT_17197 [Pichia membranifaciens NRRL Y-2026]ODQ45944.1 hypothetical protein PICMEDRAFT_17197 [Pichia membranifaciens NRRL Y-2026]
MTVVDSINVVTPQSAMAGEDKINVDTVINKNVGESGLVSRDSMDVSQEDYEGTIENHYDHDYSSDGIDNQNHQHVMDHEYDYNAADVVTLNESMEELKLNKYHYNYASAIDNLSSDDVGLMCFPIQKRLQVYKNGSNFTLLCVGESGVGKTSFINTLFDSLLIEKKSSYNEDFSQHPHKTTVITHHKMDLIEDGFKMRLNIIDTPGFGDYIDNKYCWYPIARYIDEQYRRLVYQENQPNRSNLIHSEVHACLYFIAPSAIGLTALDIDAMRNLSTRVNLIPIITKADGFTNEELSAFKQRIRNTLKEENISICELIDEKSRIKSLINEMPFSTINSVDVYANDNGDNVRGRKYKWGLSEVENPKHCDFLKLRDFLIESYMGDLISSTENYYENYRRDFMKYRLGKAINLTINEEEMEKLGIKEYDREVIVPSSRGSWKSISKDTSPSHPSLDQMIDTKSSIEILELLNRISLGETEKELVELNPAYLEMEKQVKKKFTGIVQLQNQKFKDWKRTLFEKQDKFNKDIEQVHHRMIALQENVKSLDFLK